MKKIKFLVALFILLVFPMVSVHANRCSDYTAEECPQAVAEGACESDTSGKCYHVTAGDTCNSKKSKDKCESSMLCQWVTYSQDKEGCARPVGRAVGTCSKYTAENCPKVDSSGSLCERNLEGQCYASGLAEDYTCDPTSTRDKCSFGWSKMRCTWGEYGCAFVGTTKTKATIDADYSCVDTKYFPIFQLLKFIIVLIQIAVPFALIIWGSLDWFKALIAHDEKEMRMKRKPFISRVIAALIIFLLPFIIQFISKFIVGQDKTNTFWLCYSEAEPIIDFRNVQNSTRTSSSTTSISLSDMYDKLKNWANGLLDKISDSQNEDRREGTWADNDPANNSDDSPAVSTCSEYSYIDCPKIDSQGNPCTRGHIDSQSGAVCMPNSDAKTCSDYSPEYCPPSDDYDYACEANPNCSRVTNAQGKEMTKEEYDARKAEEERIRQIQEAEEEQRRNNGGNAR